MVFFCFIKKVKTESSHYSLYIINFITVPAASKIKNVRFSNETKCLRKTAEVNLI